MTINQNLALLAAFIATAAPPLAACALAKRTAAPNPQSATMNISTHPTRACSRFAAPDGRDSHRGTKERPFRTAQRLVDSLRPGQTGCLRGGMYSVAGDDDFVVRLDHGGRAGAPITLQTFPGERATLVGNIEVSKGSDYVTLSRLRIEGTGGSNTIKIYAAHITLEDSDITNAWRGWSCLLLGSDSYGVAVWPIVRGNRFHECGSPADGNQDHGIYAQSVVDGRIIGNVFWNSAAYAIQLYPNAQRTRVEFNVIDGGAPSVRGGVIFAGDSSSASSGNVVDRNVIAYAMTYNIAADWHETVGTGNIAARNCLWGGTEGNIETSAGGFRAYANVVANPEFRNRQSRDYRLRPGSRCRRVIGADPAARLSHP